MRLFDWKILENNVVRFTLDNLILPDSGANEAASHGFVRFKIRQKPNLADGTLIENRAAIFFDYNPAILTNTVFHTVGRDFLETSATTAAGNQVPQNVVIAPNPATENVTVVIKNQTIISGFYRVVDCFGRTISTQPFNAPGFEVKRNGLAAGVYLLEICTDRPSSNDRAVLDVQKLIWH